MTEHLLSVGIDLGTSTTQVILSRLRVENQANPFSVPRMAITDREILYRSPIHFTPLLDGRTIDAEGVRRIVDGEYRAAGIIPSQVETGAVIITGETARKENAEEVLAALSALAGDFVVATAGPDLESILAARGAGADTLSRERHASVLHFDIGGGTANLAFFEEGELTATGCYDIGGRLIRCNKVVDYVAPVLQNRFPHVQSGQSITKSTLDSIVRDMAETLAQAAGLLPADERLTHYATAGASPPAVFHPDFVTFSGGVALCLWKPPPDWNLYGDIGPLLGEAVREVFTAHGGTILETRETIRATVVGAGSYATELSGSTVFHREVPFPLKNIPILTLKEEEISQPPQKLASLLTQRLNRYADQSGQIQPALSMKGFSSPGYRQVEALAEGLALGMEDWLAAGFFPIFILENDMAKVLGQALSLRLKGPLLCLDGIAATQGDYIDIGTPIAGGSVLPVVIKTLAFEKE